MKARVWATALMVAGVVRLAGGCSSDGIITGDAGGTGGNVVDGGEDGTISSTGGALGAGTGGSSAVDAR